MVTYVYIIYIIQRLAYGLLSTILRVKAQKGILYTYDEDVSE